MITIIIIFLILSALVSLLVIVAAMRSAQISRDEDLIETYDVIEPTPPRPEPKTRPKNA